MNRKTIIVIIGLVLIVIGALALRRGGEPVLVEDGQAPVTAAVRHPGDSDSRPKASPAGNGVPFSAQASQPKATGREAPDFTLKDLAGKDVSLSQYRGKKVVILDFWATWCGPCIMAMPMLERYRAGHPADVEVLSVNQREDPERVAAFLKAKGKKLNVVFDSEGDVSRLYRVYGLPTLLIIDKEGVQRYRHVGFRPDLEERLEKAVTPLFKK